MATRAATVAAACARLGCSAEEYEAHVDAGESWCSGCRAWLHGAAFHGAMDRPTGARARCKACRHVERARYWRQRAA